MAFVSQPSYTADGSTLQLVNGVFSVKAGGISNTEIGAAAAIAYGKLALTGALLPADLAAGVCKVARGTYTGNASQQNVVVGFRPQVVLLFRQTTVAGTVVLVDAVNDNESGWTFGGNNRTNADLDITANGFSAINAAYIANTVVYYWVALGGAT